MPLYFKMSENISETTRQAEEVKKYVHEFLT